MKYYKKLMSNINKTPIEKGWVKTLLLDRNTIMNLIDIRSAISRVEYSFRMLGRGKIQMPAKMYLYLKKYRGDFRAMPAYIEGINACGIKWVNVHPENKKFGLPSVMAIIILNDPKTGFPLCIMDGTYITQLRTGASGGVAARFLARKESSCIALIGCGAQARSQLSALNELFGIKEVRVWGREELLARKFINDMKKLHHVMRTYRSIQECLEGADIIVTTTPSRKPIVKLAWIKPGTHINAIGADASGKEELDPAILKEAKVVVDSWEQASHSGEINVPVLKRIIKKKDIYADIGQIVSGRKKGRTNPKEITIFDSTGLAVQDIAVADLVYKNALKYKKGKWISFF